VGYLYALGAFLLIGSYLVPVRFASSKGLAFLPFMAAGLLGLDFIFMNGSLKELGNHPFCFGMAVLSGALWSVGQAVANLALEEISLAKASVLFNLNTFLNIAVGILLFKEASGASSLVFLLSGGVLLFGGAWLVSKAQAGPAREGNLKKGVLYCLLASFFWGVYFIPVKALSIWEPQTHLSSLILLSGLALGGTFSGAIIAIFYHRSQWTWKNLGLGIGTAALWMAGTACFLLSINTLGLSRAVPIINTNSLMYAVWSFFVFKEIPFSQFPKVLSGTLLAIAGIVLLSFS
jgi:glucose uptake protein GlcU